MSEMYMNLCRRCAERMDANLRDEGTYYLQEVGGSREIGCCMCGRWGEISRYRAESKAMRAFRHALARREESSQTDTKDRRARYREPWRKGID